MKLFSYWRSTSSFRVQVALNLKGLTYDIVPVNLLTMEQRSQSYKTINPAMGVPTLELDNGQLLTQSLAIIRWLDTVYAHPPLLPKDPFEAARVEAAAQVIAMEIHAVNNLRVLTYLKTQLKQTDAVKLDWMFHWMKEGLTAFQQLVSPSGKFCFGDAPGLADICLAGQLINARRWGCDLSSFGRLVDIDAACRNIEAFRAALPISRQKQNW